MTERELVEKILRGEKDLYKELVFNYKDKILNVCYSILKNTEDAEDVTQEVFIEVFKSLSRFKWKSSLSTWIVRIAITRSLNFLKKRKSKKWLGSLSEIFSIYQDEFRDMPNESERNPFENIKDNETRSALENALNRLPDNQRIAYSLCKVEGMSNSSDFTPEWISHNNSKFDSIHTINKFSLINQNGEIVSSENLKDNIYIADFFFTSCTDICPVMTINMKKIHDKFINDNKLKIISFTVNPEVDDAGKLKEYSDKLGVKDDKWSFLTGTKKDIYTVARKSFFADDDTGLPIGESDFIHTEKFILVDTR